MRQSEPEEYVPAGASSPAATPGLNGLVPFAVLRPPIAPLRRGRGLIRVHLALPDGVTARAGAPLYYRLYGWSAGMLVANDGRIQKIPDPRFPVELPYETRTDPAPPEAGELLVDISFWYLWNGGPGIQDVQWRQRVLWGAAGPADLDLRHTLEP